MPVMRILSKKTKVRINSKMNSSCKCNALLARTWKICVGFRLLLVLQFLLLSLVGKASSVILYGQRENSSMFDISDEEYRGC